MKTETPDVQNKTHYYLFFLSEQGFNKKNEEYTVTCVMTLNVTLELFYYENQEREIYRRNLYMRIGVMKDSKTKPEESTHLTYTGLRHS